MRTNGRVRKGEIGGVKDGWALEEGEAMRGGTESISNMGIDMGLSDMHTQTQINKINEYGESSNK